MPKHLIYFFRQDAKHKRRSCSAKIMHPTVTSAKAHADRLNNRHRDDGPWSPYSCRHCHAWHVGRSANFPSRSHRNIDVTLYEILGERAYFCGEAESTGTTKIRLYRVMQRIWSAHGLRWMARTRQSP